MDPNAALAEIRRLLADHDETGEHDADRLAELVTALDEWLSRGGFKPSAWEM